MSVSRLMLAAFATVILVSALWMSSAQTAPLCFTSPGTVAGQGDGKQLSSFQPVARVSSLMSGFGSALGKINEVLPQIENEHRLRTITAWSEIIAELSNVHTQHRRKPDYLAMAADTGSIALDLARATRADTPDEDLITKLVINLDISCTTCHDAN